MAKVSFDELLDAGVHFGHLRRKWNPNMAPYIFMERNGIHIIDLYKTQAKLEETQKAIKQIAKSGRRILFVATKKQAKSIVADLVKKINMPYVTERWPGGMLTNFATIRKAVRKMANIDKMSTTNSWQNLSKRERLQITRERAKLEKNLGSISDMSRLPAALFVIDINKEKIAVAEARKLNIPIFAMVDTNTDPTLIDFAIPANDDASKSIYLIVNAAVQAIAEGLNERKLAKEKEDTEEEANAEVGDVDIKSKSEAIVIAEEAADKSAEKGIATTSDGKPKRKRKTIAKKN
ncbi:MAG: 30S ribosomal protein S2 [Bacteroidetes bacterium]|nr:30S ribosomal protein S2 [Bacteroidota bacterium]MBL6943566.1 30S ribosomal protein S2 [Bacteroidales bacterium]